MNQPKIEGLSNGKRRCLLLAAVAEMINRCLAVIIISFVALLLSLIAGVTVGFSRDLGQWANTDPAIHEWYKSLMRPDAPQASCCAESDAYWADEVHVRDGKTFAVVTDDRPDEPLGRPHLAVGTEVEVPDEKLKWDRSNPTGHNILFVSRGLFTYCFVQGSGT